MQNGKVIDADGHVFEHSVDWAERLKRLDPPYHNRAPKMGEGRLGPFTASYRGAPADCVWPRPGTDRAHLWRALTPIALGGLILMHA